jgi:hypothetical protein
MIKSFRNKLLFGLKAEGSLIKLQGDEYENKNVEEMKQVNTIATQNFKVHFTENARLIATEIKKGEKKTQSQYRICLEGKLRWLSSRYFIHTIKEDISHIYTPASFCARTNSYNQF